jgi:hypothetical protein
MTAPITDEDLRAAIAVPLGTGLPVDVLDTVHARVAQAPQLRRWRRWPRLATGTGRRALVLAAVLAGSATAAVAFGVGRSPQADARFPDGSLAFPLGDAIVVTVADGSDPRTILPAPETDAGVGTIAFSPDRRTLAVTTFSAAPGGIATELWLVRPDDRRFGPLRLGVEGKDIHW